MEDVCFVMQTSGVWRNTCWFNEFNPWDKLCPCFRFSQAQEVAPAHLGKQTLSYKCLLQNWILVRPGEFYVNRSRTRFIITGKRSLDWMSAVCLSQYRLTAEPRFYTGSSSTNTEGAGLACVIENLGRFFWRCPLIKLKCDVYRRCRQRGGLEPETLEEEILKERGRGWTH